MIDAAADGHGVALASAICADPYLRVGALMTLEGPCVPQPAYRIYCDLRTYDDDQVRRVYEWFIREAERSGRGRGEGRSLNPLIDSVNFGLLIPPRRLTILRRLESFIRLTRCLLCLLLTERPHLRVPRLRCTDARNAPGRGISNARRVGAA